ncbi:SMI1/KNR4 family protein [Kitasatospora sp. NPDC087271]|uniref:SMI1/KNR4 family protein n=1 Tax=Kitasatospora sp. NPDC087271 TaxID=3364067 RepID=UPI00382A3C72
MKSIDHRVQESWDRIATWLGAHVRKAPVRLAADEARLDAVERELGLMLPEDVREWWALADVSADYWAPGSFAPEHLDEALETRQTWLLVAEQEGPSLTESRELEPRFLPEFMPIAMSPGGDGLIVDLRPGESHGAVFLWDHENWGLGVPLWSSVGAMLEDTAAALESRTPALLWHAALGGAEEPCVAMIDESGDLVWEATAG